MAKFPVALLELDEADPEFTHVDQHGRSPKYCVELVDGDRFYFVGEGDAGKFIKLHGLMGVSDAEMDQARRESGHA